MAGLRAALRLAATMAELPVRADPVPAIASPWQRDTLEALVWSDLLDTDVLPVTRAEAMRVPAIARARLMIAGTIARVPLVTMTGATVDDPPAPWCQRTDALSSPYARMLWTVDDHLFYGDSLWVGRQGADGFPLTLDHLPYHLWTVDAQRRVVLDPEVANPDLVVYLPGPHEGIVTFGARTIRQASVLDAAALDTAQHPFRVELHQLTAAPITEAERSALVAQARSAMYANAGVLFTNAAVEARVHPVDPGALLVEGRNQAAVDCARLCGLPASLVDANTAGSSLTYETAAGRNREFVDYALATYMAAVSARLSQDDVVPRGHRAAFDLSELTGVTPTPTGPTLQD